MSTRVGAAARHGHGAAGVAVNPVLPGCYPDPSVCRVGEWFYLVSSTFEYLPGLPVHRSRDLVHWEPVGHVVDRPDMLDLTGLSSSSGLFAPTLRHHDGTFWLVCTLVDQQAERRGEQRGGNFLVTATDPAGPWSDPVWLGTSGIDPSLLFDDDGRVWVHGTRLAHDPQWHDQTEVWLRELDPGTRTLIGPEHVIWSGALIGAVWAEGPHLYRDEDGYLLVAAEGGTAEHHAVVVARADHVTGPYRGNPDNPVLTHRHLGRPVDVAAVGHADLVQAVDGSWWALLLATRPDRTGCDPLGRETFLVPVERQNGWPVFAPGVGRVPHRVSVPFAEDAPLGPTQGAAAGLVPPDSPRWSAPRHLPTDLAHPEGDGWSLPLRPGTLTGTAPTTFLGVRRQHHDLRAEVLLRGDLREQEEAGLALRLSEAEHLRLVRTGSGDEVTAVVCRGGQESEAGRVRVPAGPDGWRLVADLRGAQVRLLAGPAAGDDAPEDDLVPVARVDARTMCSAVSGGFLGTWVGVLAAGPHPDRVVHARLSCTPADHD